MRVTLKSILIVLFFFSRSVWSQEILAVVAHPIFDTNFACSEHAVGTLKGLGDELGQDCLVEKFVTVNDRLWTRAYEGSGENNADWFSWDRLILSPCDCTVTKIIINPITNLPGKIGTPPASHVVLKKTDGTHFLLAHVQMLSVKIGDQITAGQGIARVGNNGYSRSPHVHIGAWRETQPLQIRWDLRKMKQE
jgi:Peptidase family M23